MTPELDEYYTRRLSMMGDPAWKDLMHDVSEMMKATNDIAAIQDEKTLHFRRGEISIMRWILSLEQVSRDTYDELKGGDQ